MELCYWAQEWYKQGDPEQMELKLVFEGIKNYDGLTGDIDYSILVGEIKDNKYTVSKLSKNMHSAAMLNKGFL